jgi:hypothetical protein
MARAPGFFTVNLRLAKTIPLHHAQAGEPAGPGGGRPRGPGGPGGRGPGGGGGPREGGREGGGGGGGGEGGPGLSFSVSVQNLFNRVNPGPPVGNLGSSLFGRSTATAGGFGFGGGGGGGASAAGNRRVELQARFSF